SRPANGGARSGVVMGSLSLCQCKRSDSTGRSFPQCCLQRLGTGKPGNSAEHRRVASARFRKKWSLSRRNEAGLSSSGVCRAPSRTRRSGSRTLFGRISSRAASQQFARNECAEKNADELLVVGCQLSQGASRDGAMELLGALGILRGW